MGGSLFEALFGCTHSRTTFPLTPLPHSRKMEVVPSEPRTYVACLECGKELPYDWQTMRRIKTPRLGRMTLSFRRIGSHFRLRSASWATPRKVYAEGPLYCIETATRRQAVTLRGDAGVVDGNVEMSET